MHWCICHQSHEHPGVQTVPSVRWSLPLPLLLTHTKHTVGQHLDHVTGLPLTVSYAASAGIIRCANAASHRMSSRELLLPRPAATAAACGPCRSCQSCCCAAARPATICCSSCCSRYQAARLGGFRLKGSLQTACMGSASECS